jgi:hypothetical protein
MQPAQLSALRVPIADPSWPQRIGEDYSSFISTYVAPLADLAAGFLIVAVAVLLAVRVAPVLIRTWPRLDEPGTRAAVLASGVILTALAAYLLTAGVADALDGPATAGTGAALVGAVASLVLAGWLWQQCSADARAAGSPPGAWFLSLRRPVLVATALAVVGALIAGLLDGAGGATASVALGGLCALAAILLLGLWLATRLRLAISVKKSDGGDDPAAAALITALLGDLGASPPRGLEVPTGADATELSDALAAIPGAGSLATKVGTFLTGLLGATPWRAELAAVDGSCLAVRMSRSGHSVGSTVIRPSDGRDPTGGATPASDLHRLAAAFLLTTLDAHHGPFPGLVGATSWRSLGLHYIATTDLSRDQPPHTGALARAAAIDPRSGLAAIAWRHALWRRSASTRDLDEYLAWLETFQLMHAGDPALAAVVLRTAYTRSAVALNRSFLPGDAPSPAQYLQARADLDDVLGRIESVRDLGWLHAQIEAAAACLPPGPNGLFGPPSGTLEATTPTAAYNLGCWWASCTEPDNARAAVLLERATTLPSLKQAVPRDPQLKAFLGSPEYRATFLPTPRTDFFELAPVVPYARVLSTLAYTSPESLALAGSDPNLLSVLGVGGRSRVTGLAQLSVALADDPALAPVATEVLHELVGRRLLTPADLEAVPQQERQALSETVFTAIYQRCQTRTPGFEERTLALWWDETFPPAEAEYDPADA